ncbi:MAG: cysteine hydrolase [Planctomycetes bacterium]|nr:cysteine hydrolase [Planctomycetota bacterium]
MTRIAFVDVDTQVDFMEPGGKLYAQGAERIKPNLARLITFARERGVPLVSSVDAHEPGDAEFGEYPPHCLRGTPGQRKVAETLTGREVIVPDAPAETLPDPTRVHPVLEKQQFSLFTNQRAEQVIGATGARELAVFGVVTEVCVRQAVLGLLERGYAVQVVEDAVWPIDAQGGARALEEMQARGARRTTTDALLAELERESLRDSPRAQPCDT